MSLVPGTTSGWSFSAYHKASGRSLLWHHLGGAQGHSSALVQMV